MIKIITAILILCATTAHAELELCKTTCKTDVDGAVRCVSNC